jgi:pimeloyl-ACP methyl ester carboxylesterase
MELAVDGRRVFAATGGRPFDPRLPAAVFLHGAGLDHTVWVLQARSFAHHGRSVLAFDLPGHGRSEGPSLPTVEAMAAWLHRALRAAGARDVGLVGHSMGALIALEAAAAAGEANPIRRLALLGAALSMPVNAALIAAAEAGGVQAPSLMTQWGLGRVAQIGGHPTPGLWLTGAAHRLLERGVGRTLVADLRACDGYKGGSAAASRVGRRTLVLIGGDDRMTPPAAGAQLAQSIVGATTEAIIGAGHMAMMERPDDVRERLSRFLPAAP